MDKDWLAQSQDNVTEWDIRPWCWWPVLPVGQHYKVTISVCALTVQFRQRDVPERLPVQRGCHLLTVRASLRVLGAAQVVPDVGVGNKHHEAGVRQRNQFPMHRPAKAHQRLVCFYILATSKAISGYVLTL